MSLSACLPSAALPELKRLNTLVLASRCSLRSGRLRFAWAGAPCTTGLTSISGLMNISPEGGP